MPKGRLKGGLAGSSERAVEAGAASSPGSPAKGDSKFPRRRPPTEAELARARAQSEKIAALRSAGITDAKTARLLGLPVLAVEAVKVPATGATGVPPEETSTPAKDPSTPAVQPPAPAAAIDRAELLRMIEAGRRPAGGYPVGSGYSPAGGGGSWTDPGSGAPAGEPLGSPIEGGYLVPSIYTSLFNIMREAGCSEAYSRGIVRGFSHRRPDDVNALQELLSTSGCPAAATRLIIANYKSEAFPAASFSGDTIDDPVATLRRRHVEEVRARVETLQLERLERELSGGSGAETSARVVALEARNRELESALRDQRVVDQIDARLTPIFKRLEELDRRGSERRTLEDVEVATMDSRSRMSAKATEEAITTLSDRVKDAPKVLSKLDRVADTILETPILTQRIQDRVADALTGDAAETAAALRQQEVDARRAAEIAAAMAGEPVLPIEGGAPKRRLTIPTAPGPAGMEVR